MGAVLLSADLACASKVTAAAERSGRPMQTAMSEDSVCQKLAAGGVELVLMDLNTPGPDWKQLVPRLRAASPAPLTIVAFGPHVHETRLAAAGQAGCDLVLTRGQFHAQVDEILAKYAGGA